LAAGKESKDMPTRLVVAGEERFLLADGQEKGSGTCKEELFRFLTLFLADILPLTMSKNAASDFISHLFFADRVQDLHLPVTNPEMDCHAEVNRKTDHDEERQDHIVTKTQTWLLAMSIRLPPTFW